MNNLIINYLSILINNVKTLVLMILMFLSFNSFSQISEAKMHYIFVIDNTGSMEGRGSGSPKNIWDAVKNKITETILSLDEEEESVISIYTFASSLEVRNINGLVNGSPITEMLINKSNKNIISQTISSISATGKQTCIYKAFSTLIDDLSTNNNEKLEKYNTRIFLFTDSEEQCNDESISCSNAFDKWCNIKSDQDFASIIKLEESNAASSLLSCISDNSCIEVIKEPITQITKVIENDAVVKFNSSQLKQIFNFRRSLDIDPAISTMSTVKFQYNDSCLKFIDDSNTHLIEVDVLNHTIILEVTDNCNFAEGQVVEGYILYNKIIFENKFIKLILKYPNVRFSYTNDHIPGVEHDYRKINN